MPGDKRYSDSTAEAMDEEARAIVDQAYQRTLDLIREHKEDVAKVAKLLLENETITHDDLVDTIGDRPFPGDSVYEEFVSKRKQMHQQDGKAENEEKKESQTDDSTNTGGLTPGLASSYSLT